MTKTAERTDRAGHGIGAGHRARHRRGAGRRGARIALHGLAEPGRSPRPAEAAALHEGRRARGRFFEGDLREAPERIAELMAAVADWGGPDILVNNAGIQRTVPLAEATAETWDAILAVNLSRPSTRCRLALPGWRRAATAG
jgi:3-hydroxybutyrate dehydrogenase